MKKMLILIPLFIVGCMPSEEHVAKIHQQYATKAINSVKDYGNGVYYIDTEGVSFGLALSQWIKENPDKKITTIAPDGTSGHGRDTGYFLITEEK